MGTPPINYGSNEVFGFMVVMSKSGFDIGYKHHPLNRILDLSPTDGMPNTICGFPCEGI